MDQKVNGTVTAVNQLGVFVAIDKCKIPALSHPDQAKENAEADLSTIFSVGDRVKARILKVDKEKKRITLGLKPSYFATEDEDEEDRKMDVDDEDNEEKEKTEDEEEEEEEEEEPPKPAQKGKKPQKQDKTGPTHMEVDPPAETRKKEITGDAELEQEQKRREKAAAEALSISSNFEWDGIVFKEPAKGGKDLEGSDEDEDAEADEANGESSKKKSKKLKAREREEQEKQVAKMEEDLLDPHRMPQSAADYERLLVASPNSSFLWIKFMAFQLGMTEIEKARAVAERALESEFSFSVPFTLVPFSPVLCAAINFREEQEKMNVWVAYLNLENTYGTHESLLKVFERSAQYNDPKKMHLHLVKIYERTNKTDVRSISVPVTDKEGRI